LSQFDKTTHHPTKNNPNPCRCCIRKHPMFLQLLSHCIPVLLLTGRAACRTAPAAPGGLRACWRRWSTDDATRYLAQSVDHVDLAYRMQRWNEVDRHDRTPLL
jgi:hypothetical protein